MFQNLDVFHSKRYLDFVCSCRRGIKNNRKDAYSERRYDDMKMARAEVEKNIKMLLIKYHAECAILFGSYARGEESDDSDIDVIVVGGENFRAKDIFAFGEELRQLTQKDVDAFEIREVNKDTEFYNNIMKEGVRIA